MQTELPGDNLQHTSLQFNQQQTFEQSAAGSQGVFTGQYQSHTQSFEPQQPQQQQQIHGTNGAEAITSFPVHQQPQQPLNPGQYVQPVVYIQKQAGQSQTTEVYQPASTLGHMGNPVLDQTSNYAHQQPAQSTYAQPQSVDMYNNVAPPTQQHQAIQPIAEQNTVYAHQQPIQQSYIQPQMVVDGYNPPPIHPQLAQSPPESNSSYVHQQPVQQNYVQPAVVQPAVVQSQSLTEQVYVQQPIAQTVAQPVQQPLVEQAAAYNPQPPQSHVDPSNYVQQPPVQLTDQPPYVQPVVQHVVQQHQAFTQSLPPVEQAAFVQQIPEQPVYVQTLAEQLQPVQQQQQVELAQYAPPVATETQQFVDPASSNVVHLPSVPLVNPSLQAVQQQTLGDYSQSFTSYRPGTPEPPCGQCCSDVYTTDSCGESSAAECLEPAGGATTASGAGSSANGESSKRLNRRPTNKRRRVNGPRLTVLSVAGSVVEYQLEAMKQPTVTFKFDQTDTVPSDVANNLIRHGLLSEQHTEVFIEQVGVGCTRQKCHLFVDLIVLLISRI